ncbi:MAG: class E sortase [Syntrophomonadaceae bacterium]
MPNSGEIAPWAQLGIPELGLKLVVVEGTSQEALALGPGWYTQTVLPGQGNTAIAGYRTMYGGPFRNIHELTIGNTIALTYHNQVYRYKVEQVDSIGSDDWTLSNPCGYNALTLATCTPEGQDKRVAVRARMIEK